MKKKTAATTAQPKNAIDLLEAQHREVEQLFEEFESATEDDGDFEEASAIAMSVCEKLTLHATIEEEIFYPAAQGEETEDLLAESAVEHVSAKRLIADILAVGDDGKQLKAMMTVLQEQIEHHVEEEEETLFVQAEELLSAEELVDLAGQMQERLDELKAEGEGAMTATADDSVDANESELTVAPAPRKNSSRPSRSA